MPKWAMVPSMRRLLLLLSLALDLAACAGSYPTPPPPPPLDGMRLARFDRVAEGVYRSAQPSGAEFGELMRRYGLRAVIKLNRGEEPAPPGLAVVRRPLDPLQEPAPEAVQAILDDVDRAPKPVLIHCTHGEDRTGLIVALY